MPVQRTEKKTWTNQSASATPRDVISTSFKASLEGIDEDTDESQKTLLESNPYRNYRLKTGFHRGKTIKQVNDDGGEGLGYLG